MRALAVGLLLGPAASIAAGFSDRLEVAHALIVERQYRAARTLLASEVTPLARLPAQQALLLAAQATTEAALHNDPQAIVLVQGALELGRHLPQASQQSLRLLLGQLKLRSGDYPAAVESLEAWFDAARQTTPEAHWLLASAYLMQDRLDAGEAQLAKGRAAKGQPPEALQRLLLTAYLRAGRPAEAAALLGQLLERNPDNPDDWRRLAALQRELGSDLQALAIMQTLHRRGWLTHESEFLALAHLQLQLGVPYRAAQLLEAALQGGQIAATEANWLVLIRAWQQAREIARARAAAEQASRDMQDPQFTLLQAQLSLQLADWRSALGAADRLLARLDAANADAAANYRAAAQAVRGIALARQRHWETARAALAIAVDDERFAAQARPWLDYVAQMIALPEQSGQ
jgi:lipopolysaccharide biosynthesis regulator YciM